MEWLEQRLKLIRSWGIGMSNESPAVWTSFYQRRDKGTCPPHAPWSFELVLLAMDFVYIIQESSHSTLYEHYTWQALHYSTSSQIVQIPCPRQTLLHSLGAFLGQPPPRSPPSSLPLAWLPWTHLDPPQMPLPGGNIMHNTKYSTLIIYLLKVTMFSVSPLSLCFHWKHFLKLFCFKSSLIVGKGSTHSFQRALKMTNHWLLLHWIL